MSRRSAITTSAILAGGFVMLGFTANATAELSGKSLYEQTCIACHGEDGRGRIPGVPDLTEKGGRLVKSDEVLITNVINGFQSPGSPMSMPAKGGNANISDADVASIVKYMRATFSSN